MPLGLTTTQISRGFCRSLRPLMPITHHVRRFFFALRVLFLFLFFVVSPLSRAVDFGRLSVLSSQGEPLLAEVTLLPDSPEEMTNLTVRLAPIVAYQKSGIAYPEGLTSLKLSLEKQEDRAVIRIRTAQAFQAPYLVVLLELSAGDMRKGREYAIVLDPAAWRARRAAPLASSADESRSDAERTADAQEKTHVVKAGETLSGIAAEQDYPQVSLEQMLVALYRDNPGAFYRKNMNWLRKGAVLSIPSAGAAGAIPHREAGTEVRLHATHFHAYAQKLARVPVSADTSAEKKRASSADGKITAQVKEPQAPASQSPDRLELSRAKAGESRAGVSPEEKIALGRALEDTNKRVQELEKSVSEIKGLLATIRPPVAPGAEPPKPAEAPPGMTKPAAQSPPAVPPAVSAPPVPDKREISASTPQSRWDWRSMADRFRHDLIWQIGGGVLVAVLLALFFMIWRRKKRVKPVVAAVPDPVPAAPPPETLSVEDVLPSRTVVLGVPESEVLPPPVAAPVPEPMMEMPEAVADAPTMENPVVENLAVENPVVANAMEEAAEKSDGVVPDQQTLPPLKLDLSNISLDLNSPPDAPSPSSPADVDEADLSVKLETALAYMDTGGDTEGIRRWLGEVIRDGSADLVDRAQAALDRLNSGAG
ncbi:MAG: hypothetical protein LBK01_08600 [Burkholderiaceae bacterium]|nr:hypothetical protein [Burkholderiaceae bacterium]